MNFLIFNVANLLLAIWMINDSTVLVNYEEIPYSLVVNWDHTGITYLQAPGHWRRKEKVS